MILFVFHDGVGIGDDDPEHNPFLTARIPTWRALAGGRSWPTLSDSTPRRGEHSTVLGADALLGVEGLPQSGTGTTALLTGINAPSVAGRHIGPFPPRAIQPLLQEENLLTVARKAGRRVAFANAYPPFYLERLARGKARRTTATQAALAAGLELRGVEALQSGRALSAWITNEHWRRGLTSIPDITAEAAGMTLARLAQQYDLTLFEYFHTDALGHRNDLSQAVATLEHFDRFLSGVLGQLHPEHNLLVMASDHGNFEAQQHSTHTLNPVLVTLWGQGHAEIARRIERITDIAPALRDRMGLPPLDPKWGASTPSALQQDFRR